MEQRHDDDRDTQKNDEENTNQGTLSDRSNDARSSKSPARAAEGKSVEGGDEENLTKPDARSTETTSALNEGDNVVNSDIVLATENDHTVVDVADENGMVYKTLT